MAAPGESRPSADTGDAIAEQFVRAFAAGWRAPIDADRFAEHFEPWFDPEVRFVQASLPTLTGPKEFREQFVRPLFALMPDIHGTVERWAVSGEDVYLELRLDGTIGRRKVTLHSCDRVTLRDGKVIERVAHVDSGPLVQAALRSPRAWPRLLRVQRGGVGRGAA
jgi:hypothetical protein